MKKKVLHSFEKIYDATHQNVPVIMKDLENKMKEWQIPEITREDLILAADEAITNIVMHAYANVSDREQEKKVEVILLYKENLLELILKDKGKSFNMSRVPAPNIEQNLKGKRRGGFGVFLMKTLMDKVRYRCHLGMNYTILVKRVD
ncbi:MAG: ATP-binding protein [Candidatus Hydrogenedentota bacterium]|nr:MAG: ATP-binding protein [Candidatus Hydrogenedentota bacterium]